MNQKLLHRVILVLGCIAILALIISDIRFARHKLFWMDEGYTAQVSCGVSYSEILFSGTPGECNLTPLFYLLSKFSLGMISDFTPLITVQYRAVSLLSAFFSLALLFGVFFRRLGPLPALAIFGPLCFNPIFNHYAAEARSYALWVFGFVLTNLAVAHYCVKPWKSVGLGARAILVTAALTLALTANPAISQVWVAAAVGLYSWIWLQRPNRSSQGSDYSALRFWGPALLGLSCLAYFYIHKGCVGRDPVVSDYWQALKSGDFMLLKGVISIFWPYQGVLSFLLNLVLVVGVLLRKKQRTTPADSFALMLSLLAISQVLLTIGLGAAVLKVKYYFVPRIFIYLVICRTLLVSVGVYLILAKGPWGRKLGRLKLPSQKNVEVIAAVGLALVAYRALEVQRYRETQAVQEYRAWIGPQRDCQPFEGSFVLYPALRDFGDPPNFLVRFGEELRRCGWKRSNQLSFVKSDEFYSRKWPWFTIQATVPKDGNPLKQVGRVVLLNHPIVVE
jgi:hypothetical protein